jgi:hypothetical protein
MQVMKKLFYLVVLFVVLLSCRKDGEENEVCFNGVVRWGGAPAADGLGWVIYKEEGSPSKPFIPRNLPDGFKTDNLAVHVCLYETNEKFYCQCVEPYNKYHIISITRR